MTAIMQHWQKEVAGVMASHTQVCHAREPGVPTYLHMDDPRTLNGLADQGVSAVETKRLQG